MKIQVEVSVDDEQYSSLCGAGSDLLPHAKVMLVGVVGDTGASLCCMDPVMLPQLGLAESQLLPPSVPLFADEKQQLRVWGVTTDPYSPKC